MADIVLVLGGARSGKSRFAQELALALAQREVLFVATAEAGDAEMERRIVRHQESRPQEWRLLEVSQNVGAALIEDSGTEPVVLVDCLTLLVTNVLMECERRGIAEVEERVLGEVRSLIEAVRRRSGVVIIVSGEVGSGLVPPTPLGRSFRDQLGWANQRLAAEAGSVHLLVAGLAVPVKPLSTTVEQAADLCRSSRQLGSGAGDLPAREEA